MADGWQPIETAPKDGTRVLIFGKGEQGGLGHTDVGYFLDVEIRHYGQTTTWTKTWHIGGSIGVANCPKPTHWMPLPAPPSAP